MKTKNYVNEWYISTCTPKKGVQYPCVMTKKGSRSQMVASCSDGTDEEIKANTLLISKSPKLLAALEKIKDEATAELHRQAMHDEPIDKLLGAIVDLCETTINEATNQKL